MKQKYKSKSERRAERLRNEEMHRKRLRYWKIMVAISGSVVVICLILLLWMGEL